jgi:hypothetical protein
MLPWFPSFLKEFKAVLKFCREHLHGFCEILVEAGLTGTVELLSESKSYPTFADWRWMKLHACCISLRVFLQVCALPAVMDALRTYLATFRDHELKLIVLQALTSIIFFLRFRFIDWFSEQFTRLQAWGTSCMCHQEEWEMHIVVKCVHRGRLLPIAFQKATDTFNQVWGTVQSWGAADWDGNQAFYLEIRNMIRSIIDRGFAKIAFLDRIPLSDRSFGVRTRDSAQVYNAVCTW